MRIDLERIKSVDDTRLDPILTLYRASFPPKERRDDLQLRKMTIIPEMNLSAILNKQELLGFIIFWDFGTFRFVEHFAIFPPFRGKNIGAKVLYLIINKESKLLLETEKPYDEASERRIKFYIRNGFHILDIDYSQPPYRKGEALLPMHLLSDSQNWEKHELKMAVKLFQDMVYYRYH
jgi:hypothetical protein